MDRRASLADGIADRREGPNRGRRPKILLLTHTFGFPEGFAATLRARLVSRALVESGASVRVFCTRHGDIPPNVINTRVSGTYEGVEYKYTTGTTTRSSSFLKRRAIDGRGLASALGGIARMWRAGELDAVYLWGSGSVWHPLGEIYTSFLDALRIPTVLELNELPWSEASSRGPFERILSPLHGMSGAVVISEYLEAWVDSEAERLRRRVPVIRVPILVDTDEVGHAAPVPSRENPFVMFACPPSRSELFRFVAQAMQQVWQQGHKCDLLIAGPSRDLERNRWLTDIETDSVHGSVVWLGTVPRETLLGLYQQARALLLPLAEEPNSKARFTTKLGEYLASGTPVVATALGELCRFARDADTAFLAAPGSADGFGQRIVDVLSDPPAAREVGLRGRQLAVAEFDYRRHGEILRDWFAAVSERGRRS